MKTWFIVALGLAAVLILAPAVVAGGGFILAAVLLVLLVLVAVVGPKGAKMWWDQYLTKSQGEKAGRQMRDLLGGHNERPDKRGKSGPERRWGNE
jgi:hypothetical protein